MDVWLCWACMGAAQLCGGKLELCKATCTVYEGRGHSGVWGGVSCMGDSGGICLGHF